VVSPAKLRLGLCRGRADLDAVFLGGFLEGGAGVLPGLVAQRHGAFALALAGVLPGSLPATTLPFAGVFALTGMSLSRGAGALAGAFVIALALALAGVETAADIRVLKDDRELLFLLLGREGRASDHPAQRANGQFVEKGAPGGFVFESMGFHDGILMSLAIWFGEDSPLLGKSGPPSLFKRRVREGLFPGVASFRQTARHFGFAMKRLRQFILIADTLRTGAILCYPFRMEEADRAVDGVKRGHVKF